ncbi:hypothetical protein E8E11_008725 [Didymella keratinophila]|nr:hypothetical protein E8E11_008725 [Didymella keratinophila]
MPSPTKILKAWIDEVPDHKFKGDFCDRGNVYEDCLHQNYHLDNQETIKRDGSAVYNLQVQINNQCTLSTFRKAGVLGKSFAWILVLLATPGLRRRSVMSSRLRSPATL